MTMSTEEIRSRGQRPRGPRVRKGQYMIAPSAIGMTEEMLTDRLNRAPGFEIVRTYAARGTVCPPIAVVAASDEGVAALHRSAPGLLVIEADSPLRAASVASLPTLPATTGALGAGFSVTIQVLDHGGRPVEHAEVQLVGERWTARGVSGPDGKIALALYGEAPETVTELLVNPRSGCWGFRHRRPELRADTTITVTLQRLSLRDGIDWGGATMRFDRLPPQYRGAGIKIALIDSGAAITHHQLAKIDHGIDVRSGDRRSWSQDLIGHGTACAGIISAASDAAQGIRGYAQEAELHVCGLPHDACCSDLVAALDYCLQVGIDVACLGFGCRRGSAIVEQRIMVAKQQGVAMVAAAGNTAAPVQFPACSPHVLAASAVGQVGSYPQDSPQAAQAAGGTPAAGGLFVPQFSCRGPELDLCAPGVAVIACQSPDGYAACDGTSLAAAHVAALAVLILAHHGDFQHDFIGRNARRVERLFQILKDTAQPIGDPLQTGAGVPDAARALGFTSQPWPFEPPLDVGLEQMRHAISRCERVHFGNGEALVGEAMAFEPPRGPAMVTRLPLNPLAPTAMMGTHASVDALKVAMRLAGLSAGS